MRVKVLEASRPYYNYGLVDLEEGQEVKGGLALHLLETGARVEALDDAAKAIRAAQAALLAAEPADGDPNTEPDEAPTDFDPDGTAADILAWVGEDPDRAAEALEAEQAKGKPRSTLVKALEKLAYADEE